MDRSCYWYDNCLIQENNDNKVYRETAYSLIRLAYEVSECDISTVDFIQTEEENREWKVSNNTKIDSSDIRVRARQWAGLPIAVVVNQGG